MAMKGNRSGPACMFGTINGAQASQGSAGTLCGIAIGGPTSVVGDNTFTRELAVGVSRQNAIGNPNSPCLEVYYNGFWRFRWAVRAGTRRISVLCLQPANLTPYPSIILRKNTSVGLNSDLEVSAITGIGWKTIGPTFLTFTSSGVIWVELHNNVVSQIDSPCWFDHIVTT